MDLSKLQNGFVPIQDPEKKKGSEAHRKTYTFTDIVID